MFLASMAYNLASPRRRPLLRRLDHAAIFLMIAGSYTPFTTQRLHGAWAWGMTSVVWTLALGAAAGKLFAPGLGKGFWVLLYLALGWAALVAIQPLLAGVSLLALGLLLAGGLVYSLGVTRLPQPEAAVPPGHLARLRGRRRRHPLRGHPDRRRASGDRP